MNNISFIFKTNLIQIAVAILAFGSMLPYFIWGHKTLYLSIFVLIATASYFYSECHKNLNKKNCIWALLFCCFLIYLSCLPTNEGTHKTWYLLIPSMLILFTLSPTDKIRSMELFSALFAISLVPGIIVWILMLMAVPIKYSHMQPDNVFKAQESLYYLHYFFSVFQSDTVNILPYGGKLARLAGVYDEPGTVGTFAALFLVLSTFRAGWKNTLIFLGGILSFSVAFYFITFVASLLLRKFKISIFLGLSFICCYITPYSPLHTRPVQPQATIQVQTQTLTSFSTESAQKLINKFDNRNAPSMTNLFSTYLNSGAKILLFGISSDANTVFDNGASSSWKILLTNYGLIGFTYLICFLLAYVFFNTKNLKNKFEIYTFLFVFLINIYQRPFIWIPSYMLLFLGAIAYLSCKDSNNGMQDKVRS